MLQLVYCDNAKVMYEGILGMEAFTVCSSLGNYRRPDSSSRNPTEALRQHGREMVKGLDTARN